MSRASRAKASNYDLTWSTELFTVDRVRIIDRHRREAEATYVDEEWDVGFIAYRATILVIV